MKLLRCAKLLKNLNLHYTRGITPKRVTSGGINLRDLAPGLHSSEETSQRWRVIGDIVSDLTGPRIEPKTYRADDNIFSHNVNRLILQNDQNALTFYINYADLTFTRGKGASQYGPE